MKAINVPTTCNIFLCNEHFSNTTLSPLGFTSSKEALGEIVRSVFKSEGLLLQSLLFYSSYLVGFLVSILKKRFYAFFHFMLAILDITGLLTMLILLPL